MIQPLKLFNLATFETLALTVNCIDGRKSFVNSEMKATIAAILSLAGRKNKTPKGFQHDHLRQCPTRRDDLLAPLNSPLLGACPVQCRAILPVLPFPAINRRATYGYWATLAQSSPS